MEERSAEIFPELAELALQYIYSMDTDVIFYYPDKWKYFVDLLLKTKFDEDYKLVIGILCSYAEYQEYCLLMAKNGKLFENMVKHIRVHTQEALSHFYEVESDEEEEEGEEGKVTKTILITVGNSEDLKKLKAAKGAETEGSSQDWKDGEEAEEEEDLTSDEPVCAMETLRLIHRIMSRQLQDLYYSPKRPTSHIDNSVMHLANNCDIFTYLLDDLEYFRIAARFANDGKIKFYDEYFIQIDMSFSILCQVFSLRKKYFKLAKPHIKMKERIFPFMVLCSKLLNDGVHFESLLLICGGILVLFDLYDRLLSEKESKDFWKDILKLDMDFPDFCVTVGEACLSTSSCENYSRNGVIYCLHAMHELEKLSEEQKSFFSEIMDIHNAHNEEKEEAKKKKK